MSKHTKEPWNVAFFPFAEEMDIVSDGQPVATTHGKEKKENAKRIVECVNACAGLPVGLVEQSVSRPSETCEGDSIDQITIVKQQRDKLLNSLKEAFKIASDENGEVFGGDLRMRETAIIKWKYGAKKLIAESEAKDKND